MENLLENIIFSDVSEIFIKFSQDIKESNNTILITSQPSIRGCLALAPIEAALLDSNIPYRRRFVNEPNQNHPSINVVNSNDQIGPYLNNDNNSLFLSDSIVEGLTGSDGDSKKGPLTAIAQSHALANEICPNSIRLRRLRPWIISGNWLDDSLDNTYDPVFLKLKTILKNEGSIRILPVTEVKNPNLKNFNWIDVSYLKSLSSSWFDMNIAMKEESLSLLAKPVLTKNLPSTARVEEIIWNCIVAPGWETDMVGQLNYQIDKWDFDDEYSLSENLMNSLLKYGIIN
ncbi:MAG: hypothetical protein HOJ64_00940 [Euryarchaeota archaeon]|jgi:hypothetical protein|nr:hypothetical protein [Euryarchaeota archaeon]MBT4392243.1 hypothetical protein [Euryarchaeota archaeon]MBT4803279.1 hypothetical protein [Euryarchaeota archaeon]MBT5613422.1 hypothetical protein [Euryarchaeota archaeon]MBT6683559.1 hypothetical protein [Euryarchaeota archaeon]